MLTPQRKQDTSNVAEVEDDDDSVDSGHSGSIKAASVRSKNNNNKVTFRPPPFVCPDHALIMYSYILIILISKR